MPLLVLSNQVVLEKLVSIPVEEWNYIHEEDAIKHYGPYAEDFQRAFGIGDGETINYMDAIGVLVASVKALNDRIDYLEGR